MKALPAFEEEGRRGLYRPSGSVSAGELADMVTAAIRSARARGLADLLVNIAAMTGFESPGPAYRRWVAGRWAQAAEGALRVAVVARREHICPEKTGLLVAAEEGLQAHICEAEPDATAWLDGAGGAGASPYPSRAAATREVR